jgi:hypothetical protein
MEAVIRSITRDEDKIKEICEALEEYIYIDDEPELGIYTRYIDLREMPPVLKMGGILVNFTDNIYTFKIGWPTPRFWTIQRDFNAIFQKRSFRVNLLKLAQQTIREKLGTDE